MWSRAWNTRQSSIPHIWAANVECGQLRKCWGSAKIDCTALEVQLDKWLEAWQQQWKAYLGQQVACHIEVAKVTTLEKMPGSSVRDSAAFKVKAGKRILPFAKHGNTSIANLKASTQVQCHQVLQTVKTPQSLAGHLTAPLQREIGKLREPGHSGKAFVSDAYAVIQAQVPDTSTVRGNLVK
jgi:hypothetical protein